MTYAAAHLNALVMTVQCQAWSPPPPNPTPLHRMPDSISNSNIRIYKPRHWLHLALAWLRFTIDLQVLKSILPDFVSIIDIEAEVLEAAGHVEDELFTPQWVQCLVHCGCSVDKPHTWPEQ